MILLIIAAEKHGMPRQRPKRAIDLN